MGACLTFDDEERKARTRSEHLDKYLQQSARDDQNVVKILLLGKCTRCLGQHVMTGDRMQCCVGWLPHTLLRIGDAFTCTKILSPTGHTQ